MLFRKFVLFCFTSLDSRVYTSVFNRYVSISHNWTSGTYKIRTCNNQKQPVPERLRRGKKVKAIFVTLLLLILSIFLNEPYQQLMLLGIIIISILQFPIFFPKEDN